MKKVLISAFKPFNNLNNNYSSEVLNYINSNEYIIDKVILDVIYDECFNEFSKHNLEQYDLIIALGEARSRKELTIEYQAINKSSCSLADNSGIVKNDEKIINNDNDFLTTNLKLDRCLKYAGISNNAGMFVCNNLYYHLLNYDRKKSLFIHIPECNDNVDNYKRYATTIENIIKELLMDNISSFALSGIDSDDILIEKNNYLFSYRIGGVLIKDDKIFLTKGGNSYSLIGGHVKIGETSEEAIIREFKEETNLDVKVDYLISSNENFWMWDDKPCHQLGFFYKLSLINFDNEIIINPDCSDTKYVWVSLDELKDIKLYPKGIKEKILNKEKNKNHFISKQF